MTMVDVVTIGGLCLDVIFNPLPDFPRPGTQINASAMDLRIGGGSAYLAQNLSALGVKVRIFAKIGGDMLGRMVLKELEERGIDVTGLIIDKDVITPVSICIPLLTGDRSFITYTRAMETLSKREIYDEKLFECKILDRRSYFILTGLDGKPTLEILKEAKRRGY